MESTEKCEVVIQHFNGKYLKTPPGIPGEAHLLFYIKSGLSLSSLIAAIWKNDPLQRGTPFSNSIMVISHLRFAGQLDRL